MKNEKERYSPLYRPFRNDDVNHDKNIFVVLVLNHNHDNTLNQNLSKCHQMEVSLSL